MTHEMHSVAPQIKVSRCSVALRVTEQRGGVEMEGGVRFIVTAHLPGRCAYSNWFAATQYPGRNRMLIGEPR